jgi:S1-C subfamily serine protease
MTQPSSTSPLQDLSSSLAALVAGAGRSIVSVHSHRSRSSGFVWRPGLIVTCDEALAEEGDIAIQSAGGEPAPAKLLGRDPTTDIALLRIDDKQAPAVALDAACPPAGALAVVVGADDGAPIAALGIVSRAGGAWSSMRGGQIDARLELGVSLRRPSEGGIAHDAAGRAFGMAVFGPRRSVLAIPSNTIERVAARLESGGRIARGYLGLGLKPVAIDGGENRGIMVMSVDANGPGAKAGIYQGDVIAHWNGEPIRHLRGLIRSLGPDSVGQTVTLGLRRSGATLDAPLTIGERPGA